MSTPSEIELPRPSKGRHSLDQELFQELQRSIVNSIKYTLKAPAKIRVTESLTKEMVTALTEWAHRSEYVLHYKEKSKLVDGGPNDIRNEGRYEKVCTIELYWVNLK